MRQSQIVWPDDDGCPEFLYDMRYVYLNEKHLDRTPSQKAMRDFLNDGKAAFMKVMIKLEEDWAKVKGKVAAGNGMDAGTEKCLALIDQLLRDHGEKVD